VYFIIHCGLPVHVMDDWKLKTTPVVRIERPNKTFVHFVCLFVFETGHRGQRPTSSIHRWWWWWWWNSL